MAAEDLKRTGKRIELHEWRDGYDARKEKELSLPARLMLRLLGDPVDDTCDALDKVIRLSFESPAYHDAISSRLFRCWAAEEADKAGERKIYLAEYLADNFAKAHMPIGVRIIPGLRKSVEAVCAKAVGECPDHHRETEPSPDSEPEAPKVRKMWGPWKISSLKH